MPLERPDDPEAHLEAVLDYMFLTPLPDEHRDFLRAMVELRSPAAHDEDYRAHFPRHDRFVFERLSLLVEAGIESGDFAVGGTHDVGSRDDRDAHVLRPVPGERSLRWVPLTPVHRSLGRRGSRRASGPLRSPRGS